MLVLIVGLVLLLAALVPQMLHWTHDYSEPVRAQVIESHLEGDASWLAGVRARPVFSYRYVHRGQLFSSSGFRPGGGQSEAAQRYLPGDLLTAWIDPEQPERAMIQPGLSRQDAARLAIALVLLVAASIGLSQRNS